MKYRELGTTLSFKYNQKNPERDCLILATYKRNKIDTSKYDLEIRLAKTVEHDGNEYRFEHFVQKQPITATSINIKEYTSRIVEYAVTHGSFNKHLKRFSQEIRQALN